MEEELSSSHVASRRSFWRRGVFVCLLIVAFLLVWRTWRNWETYPIASFALGNGRKIEIRRESWCDLSSALLCRVWDGGNVVMDESILFFLECGSPASGVDFEIVGDSSNDLVALLFPFSDQIRLSDLPAVDQSWTEMAIRQSIVLLFDFTSGKSCTGDLQSRAGNERLSNCGLLDEIIRRHPEWKDDSRNIDILSKLWHIDLTWTPVSPALHDTDLTRLNSLSHVHILSMSHQPITDVGVALLAKMQSVKELNLMGTNVTDGCIDELGKLANLKRVDVRRTGITPEGATLLRRVLPNTEITGP